MQLPICPSLPAGAPATAVESKRRVLCQENQDPAHLDWFWTMRRWGPSSHLLPLNLKAEKQKSWEVLLLDFHGFSTSQTFFFPPENLQLVFINKHLLLQWFLGAMGELLSYMLPLGHSTPATSLLIFLEDTKQALASGPLKLLFLNLKHSSSSGPRLTASLHSGPHSWGPLSGRTQTNKLKSVSSPTPVALTCLVFLLNIDYN